MSRMFRSLRAALLVPFIGVVVLDEPIALAGATMFARESYGGGLFTLDGDSLDQLVKVADARMYAKRMRNEVNPG